MATSAKKICKYGGLTLGCLVMSVLAILAHYADNRSSGFWTIPSTCSDGFASVNAVLWGVLALYHLGLMLLSYYEHGGARLAAAPLLPHTTRDSSMENARLKTRIVELKTSNEGLARREQELKVEVVSLKHEVTRLTVELNVTKSQLDNEKQVGRERIAQHQRLFAVMSVSP